MLQDPKQRWSASQLLQHSWLLQAQHSRTDLADLVHPLAPSPSEPDDYLQLAAGASPWGTATPSPSSTHPSANPSPAHSNGLAAAHPNGFGPLHSGDGVSNPVGSSGTSPTLEDDGGCWPPQSISAGLVDQYGPCPILSLPPTRRAMPTLTLPHQIGHPATSPKVDPHQPLAPAAATARQHGAKPTLTLPHDPSLQRALSSGFSTASSSSSHQGGSGGSAQRSGGTPTGGHAQGRADLISTAGGEFQADGTRLTGFKSRSSSSSSSGGRMGSHGADLISTAAGGLRADGTKPTSMKAGSLLSNPPFAASRAALRRKPSGPDALVMQMDDAFAKQSGGLSHGNELTHIPTDGASRQHEDMLGPLLERISSGRAASSSRAGAVLGSELLNGNLDQVGKRGWHERQPSADSKTTHSGLSPGIDQTGTRGLHEHWPSADSRSMHSGTPSSHAARRVTDSPSKIMAKRSNPEDDISLQRRASEICSRQGSMQNPRPGSCSSSFSQQKRQPQQLPQQDEEQMGSRASPAVACPDYPVECEIKAAGKASSEKAAKQAPLGGLVSADLSALSLQDGPLARGLSGEVMSVSAKPARRNLFGFRR